MGDKVEFDENGRIIVPGVERVEKESSFKDVSWSLYRKKEGVSDDENTLDILNTAGDKLDPLKFTNGKTQEDVVKEVLKAIDGGHKIIFVKGVCGSGKCLDGKTQVFCKPTGDACFGHHEISSLVGKDGKIISLDKSGNLIESKFKNVRETGVKKIFKLKTSTGREILASENHPFLTISKNGLAWSSLAELNKKSYICLPNKLNIDSSQITIEDAKLKILGHLISEGKLGDVAGSPKYYQDKTISPLIRQDYTDSLKMIFPDGEIIDKHQAEVTIVFRNMNTKNGTTNKLRLFVREFGLEGTKSADKFVPNIIFNLSTEKIAIFLQALFSGDGSIYLKKSRKKEQFVIEYDSISRKLILGVSLLLNRFGIQHTITSHKFRENSEYSWRINISNQEQIRKYVEKIGFLGEKQKLALQIMSLCKVHKFTNIDKVPRVIREYLKSRGYDYNQLDRFLNYGEIEKLRENIGFKQIRKNKLVKTPCVFKQGKIDFLRSHLREVNRHIGDDVLSFVCNEQIIWDKTKSIDFIKEDLTYDLEVSETHNFIANGIIVHNSAIALNLAKHFKKTSIVVPIKSLQDQYERDYTNKNFILKDDGKKLKISVIKGRGNFKCPFSGESKADDSYLPCDIELREKNMKMILGFIEQNKEVKKEDFSSITDVRRISVASACPYWSPIMSAETGGKILGKARKRKYMTISGKEYALFERAKGCGYYQQYHSYIDSDVLIFNAQKYLIETAIGRKPKTDLDVIDECDDFLDSFANEKKINLNRFISALSSLIPEGPKDKNSIKEMILLANRVIAVHSEGVDKLKSHLFKDLFDKILDNPYLAEGEDGNYYNSVFESVKSFEDLTEETYVAFEKAKQEQQSLFGNNYGETTYVSLVSINVSRRFKDLIEKNNVLVLMSGTLHSEKVLKDIFGLEKFKVIEAETQSPGTITKYRTGLEKNCKYELMKSNPNSRAEYLKALSACIANAKTPTLVHISSFGDLPTEEEKKRFGVSNIISREELGKMQENNESFDSFKSGKTDLLFTTKCSRGVDFPGEQCNSIILTKYPYPNIQGLFWQILKREKPGQFMDFYMDKSRRDLIQKVARGVRFKGDHVLLLSPDSRIFDARVD